MAGIRARIAYILLQSCIFTSAYFVYSYISPALSNDDWGGFGKAIAVLTMIITGVKILMIICCCKVMYLLESIVSFILSTFWLGFGLKMTSYSNDGCNTSGGYDIKTCHGAYIAGALALMNGSIYLASAFGLAICWYLVNEVTASSGIAAAELGIRAGRSEAIKSGPTTRERGADARVANRGDGRDDVVDHGDGQDREIGHGDGHDGRIHGDGHNTGIGHGPDDHDGGFGHGDGHDREIGQSDGYDREPGSLVQTRVDAIDHGSDSK